MGGGLAISHLISRTRLIYDAQVSKLQCTGSQPRLRGPLVLPEQSWKCYPKSLNSRHFKLKINVASKEDGYSNKFIVRCSPTFKRLGNTALL